MQKKTIDTDSPNFKDNVAKRKKPYLRIIISLSILIILYLVWLLGPCQQEYFSCFSTYNVPVLFSETIFLEMNNEEDA